MITKKWKDLPVGQSVAGGRVKSRGIGEGGIVVIGRIPGPPGGSSAASRPGPRVATIAEPVVVGSGPAGLRLARAW